MLSNYYILFYCIVEAWCLALLMALIRQTGRLRDRAGTRRNAAPSDWAMIRMIEQYT